MSPPDDTRLASDLLAASIHEIKNRLGTLVSRLDQLLASLPLNDQHQHPVDQIKSESQFIGDELVRVLASYKALGTDASANVDQQFLLDVLEEKVARHSCTTAAHQLQLDFECDEDLTGFFDAGIISVVLDTGIYNAVKEGVSHIMLTAHLQGDDLLIQIHDNGPGFPPAMLERPIVQGALKAASGSTGMGLYFAQRLLGLQQEGDRHGQISLDKSDRLGGACLTLHLPQ